ncbi:glutaredoxin [Peptoniphilus koenoeneniae]|uniref:Glutaredoxin n=1 Tax=Peptoniphilus koenoeneniae TaxID=507751 RepID=A0ABU0AUN4_9FIRM|nr:MULTISPECIES: glutathione S-transferase N-terminal domain-containing protein [Peptoniphilus]ERT59016.1 glutaredoxin [Peptoniphilus sp. BV3C26]MDQ0274522.1 glutaredoxin [Peptoniphilus koenoeneniae]
MENLRLYVRTVCPFCRKVEKFLEEKNISAVEIINIDEDKEAEKFLVEKGGKRQVPCLFIGDKPMYESMDIINYLKETFA